MAKERELELVVDPLRLDGALLDQPDQRYYWGVQLADAQFLADGARGHRDVIAAEADKAIRDDPEAYGLVKATETTVPAAVKATDGYIEADAAYAAARHRVLVLQAAVDGLEHRKRTLTLLVELHTTNYYSEPHAGVQVVDETTSKDVSARVKKKLNVRRKK